MKRLLFISFLLLVPFFGTGQPAEKACFSVPGGFYEQSFSLEIFPFYQQHHIRFTTNGNRPTAQSQLYTEPLLLDESLYSTSNIYTIQITPDDKMFYPDSVPHCIVIRAAVFNEADSCISEVATNSYFIKDLGCDTHGLPVVSLCADSLDLFDFEHGIFVPGVFFDSLRPDWTGNYYKKGLAWERLTNVEFYELDNTGINQTAGLRTHGGNGRRYQQKSVKLFAREEYGKKRFKHKFFETIPQNNFKHLVLKPFEASWNHSGVNDHICNQTASKLNLEALASRPTVLYLNGEYWGVYFINEKPDERYLEDHLNVDIDKVNIMGNWVDLLEHGSSTSFMALCKWMESADLSQPEDFAYIESKIDLDCFIDYQIFELFIANNDWPANNMRCWQVEDGKWRWFFYDGDACLRDRNFDVFANATYDGDLTWPSSRPATLFFRKLLENQDFRGIFTKRFNELISTVFEYQNTIPYYEKIKQELQNELPNQIQRFANPSSYDFWASSAMNAIDVFLMSRGKQMLGALSQFFLINEVGTMRIACFPNPSTGPFHLLVETDNSGGGMITIYDLLGRMVYSQPYLLSEKTNEITIHPNLAPGVYLLNVGGQTLRIVKTQ